MLPMNYNLISPQYLYNISCFISYICKTDKIQNSKIHCASHLLQLVLHNIPYYTINQGTVKLRHPPYCHKLSSQLLGCYEMLR